MWNIRLGLYWPDTFQWIFVDINTKHTSYRISGSEMKPWIWYLRSYSSISSIHIKVSQESMVLQSY